MTAAANIDSNATLYTVGPALLQELIIECLKEKIVPMVWGSPGIGKSQIVYAIAKLFNALVIDIRLAQCDPIDLNGYPVFVDNKGRYVPMETFPVEGDELPLIPGGNGARYSGWIIFMDELTSAPRAVQSAAYKPILDRMVGTSRLHEKALIVAAGNYITDNAVSEDMSTALQSRMIHFNFETNLKEWLSWAYTANMDHRITAYLKSFPEALYKFSPDHNDHTYECPRTWEFTHKFIKNQANLDNTKKYLPLLAGTISLGGARNFLAYCQIYPKLPSQHMLETQPLLVDIPDDPSVIYALIGIMGTYVSMGNIDSLMEYIERLPLEFQAMAMQEFCLRIPSIGSNKSVQKWVSRNPREIFW